MLIEFTEHQLTDLKLCCEAEFLRSFSDEEIKQIAFRLVDVYQLMCEVLSSSSGAAGDHDMQADQPLG